MSYSMVSAGARACMVSARAKTPETDVFVSENINF